VQKGHDQHVRRQAKAGDGDELIATEIHARRRDSALRYGVSPDVPDKKTPETQKTAANSNKNLLPGIRNSENMRIPRA
jgi:hypothetical protein